MIIEKIYGALEKAKYLERTGTPGHYKYRYRPIPQKGTKKTKPVQEEAIRLNLSADVQELREENYSIFLRIFDYSENSIENETLKKKFFDWLKKYGIEANENNFLNGTLGKLKRVELEPGSPETFFFIEFEEGAFERRINEETRNVYMSTFFQNPNVSQPPGVGTKAFKAQIDFFKNMGMESLNTHAAGSAKDSDAYNGYYTWARCGYSIRKAYYLDKFRELIEEEGGEQFKDVKNLPDLMAKKGGPEFWRKNGFEFDGVFDLNDNSINMKTLKNYLREKGYEK